MKTEQHATEHTTEKKDINTKVPDTGKDSKDINTKLPDTGKDSKDIHSKIPDTGKDSKDIHSKIPEKAKDTKVPDVKDIHHDVKAPSDNKDKDHHVNK